MTDEEFDEWFASQVYYTDLKRFEIDGVRKYAALYRLMFHWALIVGTVGNINTMDDKWCYGTYDGAKKALDEWDCINGEPDGWHRHPMSGRRRDIDEETSRLLGEYVDR